MHYLVYIRYLWSGATGRLGLLGTLLGSRSSVRTQKFMCAKFYFHECQVRTWPVKDINKVSSLKPYLISEPFASIGAVTSPGLLRYNNGHALGFSLQNLSKSSATLDGTIEIFACK